ncbi:MAG TPA: hypothetical protein VFG28_15255 [Syntrophales bacterium]|nr:hypothetical protein [Syntrophales bacterium]
MIIISILAIILITSIILYSLCRIPSRVCREVCSKSLVFDSEAEARRFEDLLSDGDDESIHRILKALQQRGEIELIESEKELRVCGPGSTDQCSDIFGDLIASDHHPLEYLQNLRVRSPLHADLRLVDADKEIPARGFMPVSTDSLAKDDLFASEYDVSELLGSLCMKPGLIFACQIPS